MGVDQRFPLNIGNSRTAILEFRIPQSSVAL
jgi:hypothetical protein